MTFIADVTTRENRARIIGLQSASLHIGTSLGPAIGGIIAGLWGFRVPFFVLSGLCAFSALWAYFRLPETKDWTSGRESVEARLESGMAKSTMGDKPGITSMLSNLTFVLVSLVTLMLFFTRAASHHTLLPIIGASSKVGLSMMQLGVAFSIISFINMLMTVPAGIFADRYGRKAIILPGILLDVASLVLFSFSTSYLGFIVAGVLMGLGTGMANPIQAAYAADLARKGNIGVTMGLFRTFGDAGFFIGPVLLGWIADRANFESALWVNAGLLTMVALLLAIAGKETVVRKRQEGLVNH
jgi:MFS family permease